MKTRLRLCEDNSPESNFYHLLDDDISVEINDVLNYNDYHIHLDTDGLEAFNFLKLYLGNYKVVEVYYSNEERNENIRNLVLIPLINS